MNQAARRHALLVALANLALCAQLVSWGLIAARPWAS
jgi:hypothetical protein